MPIYEYQCEECERQTEALQRVDEPPLAECPHCGGTLRKLISAPAFQFKGSGWYVTDYAGKSGGGEKAEKGEQEGGGGEEKGAAGPEKGGAASGAAGSAKGGGSDGGE